MRRDAITLYLKTYQRSERKSQAQNQIELRLLQGINRRILERHKMSAERAVRKVLEMVYVDSSHLSRCLEAMTQLCRDDQFAFMEWQDVDLIRSINFEVYFAPLSAARMVVETQEGIV